ncbi:MAG: glycosyltransferase family 9 protein, partial [Verrucomicrobia bacterium]|nr:glycosyltransferase family 9 protein [Verrucomicrobiota bacterium]
GKKLHLARVFLKDCGLPVENWQPRISIPTGIREAVARRFGFRPGEPIIALHSGRTWPVRELPAESWREIVRRIKQRFQGRLIHFCAPTRVDQLDLPVQCFEDVQAMPENLELVAVAAVLSQCRLLIGIDSGLLHLAGTVGTPTLGVFGAVNPEFRLPVGTPSKGVYAALPCSFCHHETPIKHWLTGCPYDIRCMKEISVDQVMKAVESILDVK